MSETWLAIMEKSGAIITSDAVEKFLQQDLTKLQSDDACIELGHFGLIKVSGVDALSFLQGQISCDMNAVTDSTAKIAIYANLQGRIIANFICFKWGEEYYLRMHRSLVISTLEILKKYAVFSKVRIEDTSNLIYGIGISGSTLGERADIALPHTTLGCIATHNQIIISVPGIVPRFEIYADEDSQIKNWNTFSNVKRYSHHAWRLMDMQAGIANIYLKTQAEFLPHRLNYHLIDALDFNKGCYFGQEIIARMHYRGKLKHHCYFLELHTNIIEIGQPCFDAASRNPIGYVIDAITASNKSTYALVELSEATMPITQIATSETNPPIDCQVLSLPYSLE